MEKNESCVLLVSEKIVSVSVPVENENFNQPVKGMNQSDHQTHCSPPSSQSMWLRGEGVSAFLQLTKTGEHRAGFSKYSFFFLMFLLLESDSQHLKKKIVSFFLKCP